MQATDETSVNVEQWKIKRLIRKLEQAKGYFSFNLSFI